MKTGIKTFLKLLDHARHKHNQAYNAEYKLFSYLESKGISLDTIQTGAPNADNLGEAISCYLHYGEYTEEDLAREVELALKEAKRNHAGDHR